MGQRWYTDRVELSDYQLVALAYKFLYVLDLHVIFNTKIVQACIDFYFDYFAGVEFQHAYPVPLLAFELYHLLIRDTIHYLLHDVAIALYHLQFV